MICEGEREKKLQGCNGLDDPKGLFPLSSVILSAFSPQALPGLLLDESFCKGEDGVGVVCENFVFQTTFLFWKRQSSVHSLLHKSSALSDVTHRKAAGQLKVGHLKATR